LPILLSATSNNPIYDPLTSSTSAAQPSVPLPPSSLPQFLTDLSARFTSDPAALPPILESILSHLFQSFFQVQPPVDLVGGEWRKWIGALEVLVSVKGIAQLVPSLAVFFLASAAPEQVEWFSLLGPLTRLSVFPREWVSLTGDSIDPGR
jgi:ubiquitin conjugation factor E4 B